jgi:hypothetical protein
MASRENRIHALPGKPRTDVFDRKYMAGTTFMAETPRCPQCGSKTFTLYGCAISCLRRIYENGRPAPITPADVTLKDEELFWPDLLECKVCGMTTYFR